MLFKILLFSTVVILSGCSSKDKEIVKAENIVKNDYFVERKDAECSIVDSYWLSNVYIEVAIKCNFKKNPRVQPFPIFLQFHRADYNNYNISNYSKAKI